MSNLHSVMRVHHFLLLAVPLFFSACTTLKTQSFQPDGIKVYRRVYVEPVPEDEFQVAPALTSELSDMGFDVVGRSFVDPSQTDLLAKASPIGGWDMTRYLQSLQIQFVDAKTGRLVMTSSFFSKGVWLGVREARLKAIFNDIRQKNGFPPSKQFR